MDVWPVTLPQAFKVETDNYTKGNSRVYSNTDSGVPRVRRRSSAVPDFYSGEMVMTSAQLATMRTFYDVTCFSGSLPFTYPNPFGVGTIAVRFDKERPPSWRQLVKNVAGKYYSVALAFEVLP